MQPDGLTTVCCFFSDDCEVRTHLDSYELLTVICEELSDTTAVGELQHVALNIYLITRLLLNSNKNLEMMNEKHRNDKKY